MRSVSTELSHKAKTKRVVCLKISGVDSFAEARDASLKQQEAYSLAWCQMKENEEALHGVCPKVSVAKSNLKRLQFMTNKIIEHSLVVCVNVTLRASLRDATQEQLNARVAKIKAVRLQLQKGAGRLISLFDGHTKLASKQERLRTHDKYDAATSAEQYSNVKNSEQSAKRAEAFDGLKAARTHHRPRQIWF